MSFCKLNRTRLRGGEVLPATASSNEEFATFSSSLISNDEIAGETALSAAAFASQLEHAELPLMLP